MAATPPASASFSPSLPDIAEPIERPNRSSIDESVELEHALNSESLPPTPAYHITTHHIPEPPSPPLPATVGGLAFDPGVLAHIITQLRTQLREVTAERDMLARPSEELEYKEALTSMAEKATRLEEELSVAKEQNEEDKEAISLLRAKVEESRRGLMQLQTQSKRQSLAGPPPALDMSRANSYGFTSIATPKSSKRASFTPMTGTLNTGGHRRILSNEGVASPRGPSFAIDPATPNGQDVFVSPPTGSSPPRNPRRLSSMSMFAASTSPRRSISPDIDPEVEALRREVKNLKDTLEETRLELSEAVEAREAADVCVQTLRQFIDANRVGEGGGPIPPLPESVQEKPAPTSGWGFGKLFQAKTTPEPPSSLPPPAPSSSSASTSPNITAGAPALGRKIGSFFASRSNSISSTTSSVSPLQSNAAIANGRPSIDARASIYSASDASSIREPISPIGEESPMGGVKVRTGSEESSPVHATPASDQPKAAVSVAI